MNDRSSATPGAQDDVRNARGAGRRVDPRLDRVQLDHEVVVEQPAEVVGTYVVRGVDASGLHALEVFVIEVVVDGEQQPARVHRVEQSLHGGFAGGLRHKELDFSASSASAGISSMALAVAGILMPSIYAHGQHTTEFRIETVSVGVAICGDADDAASMIKRADERLYEAKGAGRNCVRA